MISDSNRETLKVSLFTVNVGKIQSAILFCFRTTRNCTVLNVGPKHYFGANVKYFEFFAVVVKLPVIGNEKSFLFQEGTTMSFRKEKLSNFTDHRCSFLSSRNLVRNINYVLLISPCEVK